MDAESFPNQGLGWAKALGRERIVGVWGGAGCARKSSSQRAESGHPLGFVQVCLSPSERPVLFLQCVQDSGFMHLYTLEVTQTGDVGWDTWGHQDGPGRAQARGAHTCDDVTPGLTCPSGRPLGMLGGWGKARTCRCPTNAAVRGRWLTCRAPREGEVPQLDSSFSRPFEKASLTAGEKLAPVPLAGHCEQQRVLLLAEAEVHPAVKDLKCKNPRPRGGGERTEATSEEMQAAPGVEETVGWGSWLWAINKAFREPRRKNSSGERAASSGPGTASIPPAGGLQPSGSPAPGGQSEPTAVATWCPGVLLLSAHLLQKDEVPDIRRTLTTCLPRAPRGTRPGPSLSTPPCFCQCTSSVFPLISGHSASKFSVLSPSGFLTPTPGASHRIRSFFYLPVNLCSGSYHLTARFSRLGIFRPSALC